MQTVLVIAPHMDDEVLGCGGAIARHVALGDHVEVCFMCNRAYERQYDPALIQEQKEHALEAQKILGYQKAHFLDLPDERLSFHFQEALDGLEPLVQKLRPTLAYTSHAGDLHQDHRTVAHASNIALRAIAAPFVEQIFAYEVPSGSEQTFPGNAEPFQPTVFIALSEEAIEKKLAAMAAYTIESRPFPHPRSREMLLARLHSRGAQCAREAAEAFVLLRQIQ